MKISIKKFQIFSTIFTVVLGTILHFTYGWSNNNPVVGAFSAVNESTREHLKILFFPSLITTIFGYFHFKKEVPNYLCSKVIGILTAMIFITIVFYTYTGVLGTNIALINILIFILAVIVGEFVSYILVNSRFKCKKNVAVIILIILSILFVYFTFNAPEIGIFKDPISGGYGISI